MLTSENKPYSKNNVLLMKIKVESHDYTFTSVKADNKLMQ